MRPTSETDNVHDRHSGYPEANDPSPSPWAEAPAQREPDHDGQLYVGAAHPDTEVTPEEAEHHEPVPVDESGEPVDRARDDEDHDVSTDRPDAIETAHEDRHDDRAAPVEFEPIPISTDRDDTAHDADAAHDETAHDVDAAHHETAHDVDAAHDVDSHDVDSHDVAAHDELAADERAAHGEPAQVVPVVADRHDHAGPTADLDHDGVADRLETPADAPATTPADAPAESPAPAAAELKPGDVAVAPVAFLTDDKVQDLRQRWREAQFGFVDDPRQAAEDVRSLVNEAIDTVTASLAGQRDALGTELGDDTEQYRATVRRCRALFDRLLNL
jgi:hypothetical protein